MSIRSLQSYRAAVVLLAVASMGLGTALYRSGWAVGDEPRKEVNPTAVRHAELLSEAFHNAAEVAMPSVVTVRSKMKAQVARGNPRGGMNRENPFKGILPDDLFNGRGMDDFLQQQPPRQGMGSGVIIDSAGIVLTNNHVVEGADEVTVRLADGREFKGEDIKTDPNSDLAVVRIHGAGSLPAAVMGDSDKLHIGDWVMAIGNPFEFEQTVSSGIISAMGRELSSVRRAKFIQTDAAINPGNSGGPLINLHGEVVGINTAIATNSGSFNGIGFAIPINHAKWVIPQLLSKGSVQRAYLGVEIDEMHPDLARKLGTQRGEGLLVHDVRPDSPAAAAGLKRRDVILKFGGQAIKTRRQLQELVERVPVDSKQEIEILRDGKSMTLAVTPKALPEDDFGLNESDRPQRRQPRNDESFQVSDLGIEVTDVTADKAKALKMDTAEGVLITKVDQNKPAADFLREGMVILEVGKTTVKNVEEFKAALKNESLKDGILMYVRTPQGNRYLDIKG